jgi:phosphatidylinositol alpha-mannosyltransferase
MCPAPGVARILLTTPYDLDVVGGVNNQVWGLYRYLRDTARLEVRVLGPASRQSGWSDPAIVPVGRVSRLRMNGAVSNLTLDISIGARVRRLLTDFAPDLIHLQEPFAPLLNAFVLRHSRSVNVATFHTCGSNWLGYLLAWPFLRLQLARIHCRIAVSDTARRYVARLFPGHYTLVPNAVDLDWAAAPLAAAAAPARHELLFVGRIDEPRKGFAYLVRAYEALERQSPGRYCLVVAGPGSERLATAGLPGQIRALGRVSADTLHHLYAHCRLVCAPSVAGESFGVILLEAFAHGRPVVGFQIPGYAELVGSHPVARLVPVGDSQALAAAITAICGDETEYARLATAAGDLAAAHGWARIGPRLVELYTAAWRDYRRGGW